MTGTVRVVLAGAGRFGREHLGALSRLDGVQLAGVADLDGAAARQAAERHGGTAWSVDAAALIERLRPDGVIVATPGHTHLALASHALALGIPVLVEKPVGMSAAEAGQLAQVEARSSAFVLPGHILRFSDPHRTFVEIARSGEVGPILSVSARRHRDDSHAQRYADIDPVLMTMIHDIDLALWITGAEVAGVHALRRPLGTQRSQTVVAATDTHGAMWHLATAWTFPADNPPPDRIEVIGERGSVELEVGAHIRQHGAASRHIALDGSALDDPLQAELTCFVASIRSGTRPAVVTLRDAWAGLAAADAIGEALRTGGVVPLHSGGFPSGSPGQARAAGS